MDDLDELWVRWMRGGYRSLETFIFCYSVCFVGIGILISACWITGILNVRNVYVDIGCMNCLFIPFWSFHLCLYIILYWRTFVNLLLIINWNDCSKIAKNHSLSDVMCVSMFVFDKIIVTYFDLIGKAETYAAIDRNDIVDRRWHTYTFNSIVLLTRWFRRLCRLSCFWWEKMNFLFQTLHIHFFRFTVL